jgi:predicted MFS family arabinose efflux permease
VTGKDAYARLFTANALALLGTGVATVALALLAYEHAGAQSGAVLGTALAIKMGANILVAPLASAVAAAFPRRAWLAALDLVRAGALCLLPLVDAVWQIYALILLFQIAAASFAAAYMATVPDLLPDEADYAKAVAKAKIAYDAETLLSPLIAAALLAVLSPRAVFLAAVAAFVVSAAMILATRLPDGRQGERGALARAVGGLRLMLRAPQLRGALAIAAGATVVMAMATVNAVPLVRGVFGLDDSAAALALAAFGGGGVAAALALPRILAGGAERRAMIGGGAMMALLLLASAEMRTYPTMLALWAALGAATTMALTPFMTLLRRIATPEQRQPLYAAHFAATNAMLLLAYLAAGWAGSTLGMKAAFIALGCVAVATALAGAALWPTGPGRDGRPA